MAKVRPGGLSPSVDVRSQDRVIYLDRKEGTVVQKWPRKRGKARSGYDYYKQQEFGIHAAMAADAEPAQYETAKNYSDGTINVPRDILMMASMGKLYTFTFEDGTVWSGWRMVTPNAQLVLDMVTDVEGSLLYRAPIGWVGIAPGNVGQILQMASAQTPGWATVTPPSGVASLWPTFYADPNVFTGPLTTTSNGWTSKNMASGRIYFMPIVVGQLRTFTKIAFYIPTAGAAGGNTARLAIYEHNATKGGPGVVLADGGTVAITSTGRKECTVSIELEPGPYWLAFWCSATININAISTTNMVATPGVVLATTIRASGNFLIRNVAYGGAFPDETAQTEAFEDITANTPGIGIR